jgi:hypothetical protein
MGTICSMVNSFKPGSWVFVAEFGGKRLLRRVIADRGRSIAICTDEEYKAAHREGRPPVGIRFPRYSVEMAESRDKVAS